MLSIPFLIALFIIFSMAIFTRIYFLLKYKWVGTDTFYNLLIAQEIRKKKKLPDVIDRFVVPERYDYPPLLHWFLSLFKDKYHQKLQYVSPVLDVISGTMIFCFCYYIFDSQIAIIATGLYFFTPYTFDNSFSLSARSPGNSFLIISLLSLFLYLFNGFLGAFIISIIFSTLVLLTHRLTTQSLIVVLLSLSIGYYSLIPTVVIGCSFVLAIVFSKGFYYRVLQGHIQIIKTMGRKIMQKNFRKEVTNIYLNPVFLVFNMPIFLMLPILFLFFNRSSLNFFVIWGLSLTLLSIIWIFGQGIRHLINAVPAFSIISSIWVVESGNYFILLLLLVVSSIFFIFKINRLKIRSDLGNITSGFALHGFDYIRSHKKNKDILLCLPLDFTYNAAYFTGCTMLQSSGGFAEGIDINQKFHQLISEGKINELIQEYKARWVIIIGENKCSITGNNVFNDVNTKVIKIN